MTTPHILTNSIIRTPQYTLLVLENGNVRALRDGVKSWSKNKVRQEMPTWHDMDQFLNEINSLWWTIDFIYPVGWFNNMKTKYDNLFKDMNSRDYPTLNATWQELTAIEEKKFYDQVVSPLVIRHNLARAMDYRNNDNTYGTLNSPAARMAEDQMLELESDRTKWTARAYSQNDSYFRRLYGRNRNYKYMKMQEEKKKADAALSITQASPLPLPLPLPIEQASPAIIAPHSEPSPIEKVKLTRSLLDMLLATGIKKVSHQLWEFLYKYMKMQEGNQNSAAASVVPPLPLTIAQASHAILARGVVDLLLATGAKKVSDELWKFLTGL